jgi:hypothetical protein
MVNWEKFLRKLSYSMSYHFPGETVVDVLAVLANFI